MEPSDDRSRGGRSTRPADGLKAKRGPRIRVVRVYEDPGRRAGEHRILVDRLWPRGIARGDVDYDEWAKDLAPTSELRRWYGHDPERFGEFRRRYLGELSGLVVAEQVRRLRRLAAKRMLVLLTATRDVEHSGAAVLEAELSEGDV